MPATHLISVDLPAPLSPTSAITSPSRTSKFTASSACTAPKLFDTSRSSSVGAAGEFTAGLYHGGGAASDASTALCSYLQYFLYWPLQTALRFRKPFLKRIWSKIRRPLMGSQSVHWSPDFAFLKVPFL